MLQSGPAAGAVTRSREARTLSLMRFRAIVLCVLMAAACADDDEGDDDDIVAGDGDADGDSDADGDGDAGGCRALVSRDGAPTGLEYCPTEQYGEFYRVEARACSTGVPEEYVCGTPEECDCGDDETCVWGQGGDCQCVHPCGNDGDCGAGAACLCEGSDPIGYGAGLGYSRCVEATCAGDADCPGGRCALGVTGCFEPETFACRDDGDACTTNDDCPNLRCGHDDGHWACLGWWACE